MEMENTGQLFINQHNLQEREKKVFTLHLSYSILEGIIAGILLMNEFVFIKSIGGSSRQLAMLFQFSVLILLITVFINELIKRIQDKRRLLVFAGMFTRGPLLLLLLFPSDIGSTANAGIYHMMFLGIFFIYYMADPFTLPTVNLLLKNNYRYENFGKLYGYATSVRKICELAAVFGFSMLLEKEAHIFVYVYPLMGAMGITSISLLSRIPYTQSAPADIEKGYFRVLKHSLKNMVRIIRTNRAYRDFEIGFMFYGCGFMMSVTVIAIYLAKSLGLTFVSLGLYKNAYSILAVFAIPLLGKVIGRIDPRKFAIYGYMTILLYILFVMLTGFFPWNIRIGSFQLHYTLIVAYIFFGLFTATIGLLWSIGSSYFCPSDEAGGYQAVHMTLTGVRGMFAPLLGVHLYEIIGFNGVFCLSIACLICAIATMAVSIKRHDKS